jgi:predicted regulator of Ras-like GTPase activity (Roadblock/LC7/MglB family)
MAAYSEMLDGFTRQRGVQGGLVVSERDGIVVDSQVQLGVRASVVAALAASIYRKARLSAEAAGLGGVAYVELAAVEGRLCMVGRGDLVVVLITDSRSSVGLLRSALLQVAETLT